MNSTRILPHSESAEKAVIGALLIESWIYSQIAGLITPASFFNAVNGQVFELIEEMYARNEKIDLITVHSASKQKGIKVTAYELTQYTANIAGTLHFLTHGLIVREYWIKRTLIERIEKILLNCYDNSILLDDLIDKTIRLSDALLDSSAFQNEIKTFGENLNETITELSNQEKIELTSTGFKSQIKSVSKKVPRYKPGQLVIIAGRPGMGKTGFMLNESFNFCKEGNSVLVISIEMTARELVARLIQRETGLTEYDLAGKISAGNWHLIDKCAQRLQNIGYFIDDNPSVTIATIKAKAKILKKTVNIKAIFIDYLQLMKTNKKLPREQQVAETTAELKLMAKELQLPIFLCCQLNREVEQRKESHFKPRLSDLRESGAIEQDADIVIFPYREEYYSPREIELKGKGIIIIGKNRSGQVGECLVKINETVTLFEDETKEYNIVPY